MKLTAGIGVLLLATVPAVADDATIACLQDKLEVSDVKLASREYGTQYFTFKIKNGLSYAISGLYIGYTLKSPNRTVPWADDAMSFGIAGGVEPGETKTIKGYGISLLPADLPDDVGLTLKVLDAADPEKHPVNGDVRFIDWSEQKSPLGCS